jgi:hypothetical protein
MVLKATFYVPCKVGDADKMVFVCFPSTTWICKFFFKMTMCHNSKPVLCEETNFNPHTKLWHRVFGFPVLNHKFLEFIKLA